MDRPLNTQLERHPVYQQLNDRLRQALATDYHRGDRFLTEREISERFQVSRATANKALASLVSEGLLEFRRGIGTFVRRQAIDYDVRSLVSFTEKARAAGKAPTTTVRLFAAVAARTLDPAQRTALRVEPSERLWQLERLRLADGLPVILERRYILQRHCPDLTREEVSGSLYTAWTDRHQIRIAGADEVIRAVSLIGEDADLLQVPAGTPGLQVTAIGFLESDAPLWWERTLYRGDQYEFHSRLGPIQTATPARGKLR